jgi:hypothetical protein
VQGVENCTCYQVQPRSLAGPLTFRCSTVRIAETFISTQPGPALPGITGYKREFCTPSPAPVQPAPGSPNTCRTGMMPRPSANKSDELLSVEPAPAPPKAVSAQMTSLTSKLIVGSKYHDQCQYKGDIISPVCITSATGPALVARPDDRLRRVIQQSLASVSVRPVSSAGTFEPSRDWSPKNRRNEQTPASKAPRGSTSPPAPTARSFLR